MNLTWWRKRVSGRAIIVALVIFGTYLASSKLATLFYADGRNAPAIIFPSAGVSIAALFLEGLGFWPIVTLASLVNSFISGTPIPTALGIATGSTLQAVTGAYFLRRFKFDARIWRFRDMALLMGVAVSVTVISPSISTVTTFLSGIPSSIDPTQRWISWWLGGIVSVMLLTPFLISWVRHPRLDSTHPRRFLESFLSFASLFAIAWLIFWTPYSNISGVPMVYVLLVPFFWIALRLGNREIIAALLTSTVISLTGTFYNPGLSAAPIGVRLFQLQLFNIIIGGIFFIVSSIAQEKRIAEEISKGYIKRLEEALEKLKAADRAKTDFIAILAHELRNPLAPALTSLEFLELQEFSTPEKEAAALQAKRNIRNMGHLLDDLLDVSRIDQGKIKLQKQCIELRVVIDRVVENVRLAVESRNHELSLDIPSGLPPVDADPLRLEQVITNLITNAVKYTNPGGRIRIAAKEDHGGVAVAVQDNGTGIEAGLIPSIFDMFSQAKRHAGRSSEGLGIGLHLVKRLVELHGGSIEVRSEGSGKGSEFTVRLPSCERPVAPPVPAAAQKTEAADDSKASRKRILIVDDNEAAANALVKLFTHLGHEAHAAYQAQSGIDQALALRPHLILLDIGLPGMSGHEVAKKLREHPEMASVVIAAVSGYGQEEDRQRSREAGCDHHLVKPVDLDTWRGLLAEL